MVSLKKYDIKTVMEWIPSINNSFEGIKTEKPLYDATNPLLYFTKMEYGDRMWLYKTAYIQMSIVAPESYTQYELEGLFDIISENILPDVDGCLPIEQWWDVTVTHIKEGMVIDIIRDKKSSVALRKTYRFTYLIHT